MPDLKPILVVNGVDQSDLLALGPLTLTLLPSGAVNIEPAKSLPATTREMIMAIPGGSTCDPQVIADAQREIARLRRVLAQYRGTPQPNMSVCPACDGSGVVVVQGTIEA